jgi:Cys-tRNA(Pro)/Cys-tRNA(Cys) deacylase
LRKPEGVGPARNWRPVLRLPFLPVSASPAVSSSAPPIRHFSCFGELVWATLILSPQGKTAPAGVTVDPRNCYRQTPAERGNGLITLMSKTTRATLTLARLGVKFALHTYDYDSNADRIGLQAAEALGVEPRRLLKTLMAEVDGKPVCVVVPSDREVSMKKLAAAFAGKAANMMRPADAERLTGYHVGGISPFAQKKRVPVAIDQAALAETSVYLNGGQRGCRSSSIPTTPSGRSMRPCNR